MLRIVWQAAIGIVSLVNLIDFMRWDTADYYDYKLKDMNAGYTLPERPNLFVRLGKWFMWRYGGNGGNGKGYTG